MPDLGYVLGFLVTVGSVGAAIGLFAWRLERREDFTSRLAGLVCIGSLIGIGLLAFLPESAPADPSIAFPYPVQLLIYSGLLALSTLAVWWLFEATPWTALFCCSAGYALQNFASGATELAWVLCGVPEGSAIGDTADLIRCAINTACIIAVYVPCYLMFIRRVSRAGLEGIDDWRLLVIMVVVMLGVIGFDLVIKSMADEGLALHYLVLLRGFHGLGCALTYALEYELLVSRRLEARRQATELVLAEHERQYRRSRKNVEAINVKCHDIRHQIRRLATAGSDGAVVDGAILSDIEREVAVYDSRVETGNEALDTILSEKSLACSREGITLSCVADGAALGFMTPADIYSLFGNALDNAIEATSALRDPERRSISVVVREVAGVVSIHIENYFAGDLAFDDKGALITSKTDHAHHGFGVRSMLLTAERYGGTLTTLVEQDRFHLNAMIPTQAKRQAHV